jgi:hypothetical protein
MGIVEAIFNKVDILAVIVFMVSTLLVTSGLKGVLGRVMWFCRAMENDFFKLALSWIVGAVMFLLVLPRLFTTIKADDLTILQFIFWTLLLNGGYKLIKWLLTTWKEMREIK